MSKRSFDRTHWRYLGVLFGLSVLAILVAAPRLQAQSEEEFDTYKLKLEGFWVYSNPGGTLQGAADNDKIDLYRDLGFASYSTFAGKLDWKFTHKNHLYVVGAAFNSSHQAALSRTFTFQGQTFQAGAIVQSSLDSPLYVFGYQYDVIRRKRGHLGLGVQFDLFDTHAQIRAAAQITGGGIHQAAVSASGSLLAPIPVAGPEARVYLTNSPRVFVEGNVYGMYFFGYGNFISSAGTLGLTINKHLTLNAGYQLGSRLVVNNSSSANRIGLTLHQHGPMAGLEVSF